MTTVSSASPRKSHYRKGFALLITIALMVLLMVLAVGLIGLSMTLSIRTARAGRRIRMTARANARLALMLAIGECMKELGPDQRISAPSGIMVRTDEAAAADRRMAI